MSFTTSISTVRLNRTMAVATDATIEWSQNQGRLLISVFGVDEIRDSAMLGDISMDDPVIAARMAERLRNMKV